MRYSKEAERIMDNGGTPADWYNSMSNGFYEFYEDVMGDVWSGLLDQGYYIESSAQNGEGVVDIFVADKNGEPEGDAIETINIGDEISMFFELVASGDYSNTAAIANKLIKEYLTLINSSWMTTSNEEPMYGNNTEELVVPFKVIAKNYPNIYWHNYEKDKLISMLTKYLTLGEDVISIKDTRYGSGFTDTSIICCYDFKKYSEQDIINDVQNAIDSVLRELSRGKRVNSSRRCR